MAALGVLVVGVGSGVGVYLDSRAHQPLQQVAARKTAVPTPAVVGSQSSSSAQQAVLLTVVSTTPRDGALGIALATPITIDFNLPVNPSALRNLLAVQVTTYDDQNAPGTISQGKKPQEVVFKPTASFENGASVSVTLGQGLTSLDGAVLASDYSFNFTTIAGPEAVEFIDESNYDLARLVNAPSGRPATLSLEIGNAVPANVAIRTYKAIANDLLGALVYSTSKDGSTSYVDKVINTASMRLVNGGTTLTASGARTTKIDNGVEVTVSQPDGIYLILAADPNGLQYGSVWVAFSRYGVLLRQDDQKVVVAGEDLTSQEATPAFNITFYNLLNGVHAKGSGSFSGVTEFAFKYPAGLDIAIASSGGEEVAIPISTPNSNASIRVGPDLSRQPQIFLTTDRPAYLKGETVRFAGIVRVSNDQAYAVGGGAKLSLWTALSGPVASATVASDGTFSGSFRIPAAEYSSTGLDSPVTLFAGSSNVNDNAFNPFSGYTASTSIVAIAPNSTTNHLSVTLDKSSYMAGEQVVASITGLNANRQPLAGQAISLAMYAAQHGLQPIEMDSFPSPTFWGESIATTVKVNLDSTGHATYRVTPKVKATDQDVTLVAINGRGKTQAYAATTATFYQAEDEAFFLAGRSTFVQGDAVVAPFVVEDRSGARVAGAQLAFQLERTAYEGDKATTTVVASGAASSDVNGIGTVRSHYTGSPDALVLRLTGKDQSGRTFQVAKDVSVFPVGQDSPRLDVATDRIVYRVGDAAKVTVTSPVTARMLLSLERGRVHQYRWVQIAKGDNAISVSVTPDLAPGFNMVFSYIQNGIYSTEEWPVSMDNSSRLLKVAVTADKSTYTKGQIAHVSVDVTDGAGAPVAAAFLADGYEARMTSNLSADQGSIAAAFLTPNRLGTNGSSSLVSIGTLQGACGGGGPQNPGVASGMYPGLSSVWLTHLATNPAGHTTFDVPMNLAGSVRLVVFANTSASSWGQAETVLNVQ